MKDLALKNGISMPPIAFGCWHLEMGADTKNTVIQAINCGYRSFDTAYSYGNDYYVARGLKESGIARNELFITSKVWNSFRGKENVLACCKKSLHLMKMDYFDLYLIHWPSPITQINWIETNLSTWEGMEQLYKDGLVRAIGVSNFAIHHLQALIDCDISYVPMVNQIEFHPGYYPEKLLQYCHHHQIAVEGWSPLGSGEVLKNPLIIDLSVKYSCSVSQICLSWAINKGVIPIPRTRKACRMMENINAMALKLEPEDIEKIDALERIGWSGFDADYNQPI